MEFSKPFCPPWKMSGGKLSNLISWVASSGLGKLVQVEEIAAHTEPLPICLWAEPKFCLLAHLTAINLEHACPQSWTFIDTVKSMADILKSFPAHLHFYSPLRLIIWTSAGIYFMRANGLQASVRIYSPQDHKPMCPFGFAKSVLESRGCGEACG